jgi:hypothetical protein
MTLALEEALKKNIFFPEKKFFQKFLDKWSPDPQNFDPTFGQNFGSLRYWGIFCFTAS